MKSWVASFRSFLERNKIFFETVVMVTLTILGVLVSRSANRIIDREFMSDGVITVMIIISIAIEAFGAFIIVNES